MADSDARLDWLLDADPSIRWQVMRGLTDTSPGDIAKERARVATEGWGTRLLGLQSGDGNWGGGAYSPKWISTTYTLLLLRHLGIDPGDERVRAATDRVQEKIRVGRADHPFFEYIGETCISGMVLALNSYFREAEGARIEWLLENQKTDGGWNCATGSTRSSFNTTISVLEGLLEYERAVDGDRNVSEARDRAHDYLLERQLMYRLSDGELINKRWLLLSFPPRWFYDVLRALEYLADARTEPDERCAEAIEVVRSKQRKDGTWPLQGRHPGKEHFVMEPSGKPSRWNTLRAIRVLDWYGGEPNRA
ncbi:MAG: hypothetical protein ACLFRT_08220 [Actinomycetota bacterium]